MSHKSSWDTFRKWRFSIFSILFAFSVNSLISPAPSSMLCRRCGLCSRRNRKINIVLGGMGENVNKMLKNRILLPSVSTLLSRIVALKSGFDYLLECCLPSTFARITSVLPENFSNWGGPSPPPPRLVRLCYQFNSCSPVVEQKENQASCLRKDTE